MTWPDCSIPLSNPLQWRITVVASLFLAALTPAATPHKPMAAALYLSIHALTDGSLTNPLTAP